MGRYEVIAAILLPECLIIVINLIFFNKTNHRFAIQECQGHVIVWNVIK